MLKLKVILEVTKIIPFSMMHYMTGGIGNVETIENSVFWAHSRQLSFEVGRQVQTDLYRMVDNG